MAFNFKLGVNNIFYKNEFSHKGSKTQKKNAQHFFSFGALRLCDGSILAAKLQNLLLFFIPVKK